MASSLNKTKVSVFTGNGANKSIILGFKPKVVKIMNVTDGIDYVKTETMLLQTTRKEVIAGDKTFVNAIAINSDGFTFIAAENVAAKVFHYIAVESQSDF